MIPYRLYGSLGSPYSLKMRAVMRYRRLPFVWIQEFLRATQLAKENGLPPVVPLMQFPDASYHNDSSKLIDRLESKHPHQRSIIPPHPGIAFIARLIEDFADEWLTKLMFLHRWRAAPEQELVSRWLAFDNAIGQGDQSIEAVAMALKQRQIGRMALVGCTPENQALLSQNYVQICDILNAHVRDRGAFLFGDRPSLAEFSLFGQLSQLASDPQPRYQMIQTAPYCNRWLAHMDDLSGLEAENWLQAPNNVPEAVTELLLLIGDVYLPFLVANAAALEQAQTSFTVELQGMKYQQDTFAYQKKCWLQLKSNFAALDKSHQTAIRALLEPAKCWAFLQ